MKLEIHPLAADFPPMSEEALAELADDIKANGQLEPIAAVPSKLAALC